MKAIIEYYRRMEYILPSGMKIYVYRLSSKREVDLTRDSNKKNIVIDKILEELVLEEERRTNDKNVLILAKIEEDRARRTIIGHKPSSNNEIVLFPSLAKLKRVGVLEDSSPQKAKLSYFDVSEDVYVYDIPLPLENPPEILLLETEEGTRILTKAELSGALKEKKVVRKIKKTRERRKTRRKRKRKTRSKTRK